MALYWIADLNFNEMLPELLEWSQKFIGLQNLSDLIFKFLFQISYFLNFFISSFVTTTNSITFLTTIYMLVMAVRNVNYIKTQRREFEENLRFFSNTNLKVSVLIPARNEEKNIENCVRSLMNQSYINYEILVMNDGSTDSTLKILKRLKSEFDRRKKKRNKLRYFTNSPLPQNWYGKSWAIQNLAKQANGVVLMITDADTVHSKDSIRYCVHCLFDGKVDFVSGFPKQNLTSFGLKLIIPSMYLMSSYIIPLWLIDQSSKREISLAIGQLMVIYKDVFDKVNGLEGVSNKICEDLQFARLLKTFGYKTLFVGLEDHITTNMYDSFTKAFLGMGKNIFSAIDYSWSKYLFTTLIFGSILTPVISLVVWGLTAKTILDLLSVVIFTGSWFMVLKSHKMSGLIAFCFPLMMVILFSISLYSTFITFFTKGHVWKGRRVN